MLLIYRNTPHLQNPSDFLVTCLRSIPENDFFIIATQPAIKDTCFRIIMTQFEETRHRMKDLTARQVATAEDSGAEPEHQSGQHGDGESGGEVQPLPDQELDRLVIGEWIDW